MQPEESNDLPSPADDTEHPLDVIRGVFDELDISYSESDELVISRVVLETFEAELLCLGHPGDIALLILRLPVRATESTRASTGEFLHRLNFGSRRKVWEMDYSDGEIRLSLHTDLFGCALTESAFRSMLRFLSAASQAAFPYLTAVLAGRMTPEFAADQAEAAIGSAMRLESGEAEEDSG